METVTGVALGAGKAVGSGIVSTGEWVYEHPAETGMIVVGAAIIIGDVVTVPSGEGAAGVVMIQRAIH